MENIIIGIDLGGTNLRIGAVNKKNNLIKPLVLKSECIASSPSPISTLCKLIEEYLYDTNITQIDAISIGVPSSVENDNATVICTTNIRNQSGEAVFSHINIAENIKNYFHVPVFVNNDVNNLMLYDTITHHLEDKKVLVGIYIGTGVGASVIINGEFLKGKNGAALDLGHIPYYGKKNPCNCGKKDAVNVMLPVGACSKSEKNTTLIPRSASYLHYTKQKNLYGILYQPVLIYMQLWQPYLIRMP